VKRNLGRCQRCGKTLEACSFCDEVAYKFLDANVLLLPSDERVDATVYFCMSHAWTMFSDELDEGEPGVPEWAMYAPTDGCWCDTWR